MKRRANIIFSFLIILYIALCSNYSYAEPSPTLPKSDATSELLSNGLTLILKEDFRTPTFCAKLFIRTGSATEGDYTGSGITHLIEHLIFKGTSTRDAKELEDEIKSLGGNIGAYTTYDYTAFNIEGPSENILQLLDIFYDIIANPKFDKKEIASEKDVIKREMRLRDDAPETYLSQQLWQRAYIRHPYKNPIIGHEDIFDRLAQEDVREYYSRFYLPDNMVLVIVGDIDSGALKEKIAESFTKLQRRSPIQAVLPREPQQLTPRYIELAYPISKTFMAMGFHSVNLASKDLYALDTLAIILGAGRSSILYKEMHNKLKLVYSIGSYNYTPFDPGMFVITSAFDPKKKDQVIKELLEKIEKLKRSPVDKKELEKARNQVISSYIFSRQTQSSQASDLGISQLLASDMDFSKHYVEGVGSVDANDIMEVAKRYLGEENLTTVLLVPSAIKEIEEDAKSRSRIERAITKKTLKNGVRVLICNDSTLPLVSIRACIKGGLRAETKKDNGISNLTAHMLTKGSGGYSEEKLFFEIESMGGTLSAYSANNSFGVSLDVMSKDTKRAIELMEAVLVKPSFPNDKLQVLKNDMLAAIELIDDDIFKVAEKNLRKRLLDNSPYSMLPAGTAESVNSISRNDIIKFYRNYCVGPNVVVSICGDVDVDEVYKLVRSKLGRIKKKRPPELTEGKPSPITAQIDVREEMDKKQAVVMVGFRTVGINSPDRYPLQIISSIFSGGSGRLYANIRQKKGLAYALGTFGMTGLDIGTFIFYAATSIGNEVLVKDEIVEEIEKVSAGDLSEDEINAAKKSLITQHELGLQSAGSFALRTALDELYDLGYNNYQFYPKAVNNLTREDILKAAKKYLNPEASVVSIVIPKNE
ncbi:MAG: insulinase family protein [Candidatus Omnitrophica bacterium]|nr:insulinase family protein [Candidatus Omnitrophota bacterium]